MKVRETRKRSRSFTKPVLLNIFGLGCLLSMHLLGEPVVLGRLEISGLNRLEQTQVAISSGLRLAEPITPEDVEAAAARLGESGFFSSLRYHYETRDGRMAVTFEVTEAAPFRRCVFDNFVGIPESELNAALRARLPMYSGELPASGAALDTASAALEELLKVRGITAEVSHTDFVDTNTGKVLVLFEVTSEVYKIAGFEFPGAQQVQPDTLVKASEQLIGRRYSRTSAAGFFRLSLLPIYRERGYLQASFGTATAEPASADDGSGVTLSAPVTEGTQFHWAGADWVGNTLFSSSELDELLGMRQGEIANGVKLDEGLQKIRDSYGRKGHFALQTRAQASFSKDDATVSYSFTLSEGPTYQMGKLVIRGWPDEDARRLKAAWKLEPGQVYDSTYLDTFLETISRLKLRATPGTKMSMEVKPDPMNLTVNVTIESK